MENLIQIASVFGTIGLLWLSLQGLRRFRLPGQSAARLQVKQRLTIATGCQLVVVDWDGQEVLLATGKQPCSIVASRTAAETPVQQEVSGAWAH